MSGPFGMPPRTRRPSINITPLIDVMFLLLIFFAVSTTFRSQYGIDVALPEAATATTEQRQPYEVVVREDGNIYLDGQPASLEQLEQSVRAQIANDPESAIVIRADRQANFQPFISALDTVRNAGGKKIVVPTEPLRE